MENPGGRGDNSVIAVVMSEFSTDREIRESSPPAVQDYAATRWQKAQHPTEALGSVDDAHCRLRRGASCTVCGRARGRVLKSAIHIYGWRGRPHESFSV